ncbi:hypothetical protein GLS40_03335 [Pseudooceanicola sp. 216_PA32_1]|uniref:VWFA domain-containing protein n=1 Tax=Pseudooceanicola pacificus TaxID=2676438 RepID=A0A844W8E6_9RHOB|nr:vWA domain-containing protein [Pseudooceanicola pacificus]MWB77053.1 hypothetical protein [Pseudooceanicola pacificus]
MPEVTCDDTGTAPAVTAEIQGALDAARVQVDSYSTAVAALSDAVSAAESAASAAPASPTTPDTSVDAAPAGETPQPPTGQPAAAAEGSAATDGATGEGTAAADATPAARRSPMVDPDNDNLFRRVLTLPNASLHADVTDTGDGTELPVFDLLYVFDEALAGGENWLEVGSSLREGTSGWIRTADTLKWSSMLVMNFAPRGSRGQVLFFDDATVLSDMVNSPYYSSEAAELYDRIRAEREKVQADPAYQPVWVRELVAIEPETAVTFDNQPYLLPILDWREEAFDGADETVLLKVAAVPANASAIAPRDEKSFEVSADSSAARNDGVFRIGVTFVIDTTVSMGPFIDRTYQTIESFYNAFQQFETTQNVSFGIVGFRDNIGNNPSGLEYVTRIFQPLDIEADPATVLAQARQIREATVPTVGFREDSFAGIQAAISEMDWKPFDARLIILVTDASAREGGDPLAALASVTSDTVADGANRSNIAIATLHLRTPANSADFASGEAQYRVISSTGDAAVQKYVAIDATSDEEFGRELDTMSRTLAQAVVTASAGEMINSVEALEPIPAEGSSGRLAAAVRNEIFRAQLESLAAANGGDAPTFLAGWAADKDLSDPKRRALEVSVFLTRNQLSTLDKRLDLIVQAYRSGGDDPGAFFDKLQVLAAETSSDPDKPIPEGRDIVASILPTFLKNLPYRSQVLRLDREYWSSISVAARQEFIESIDGKRRVYGELFNDTKKWVDFGADDPGLEATPVSLRNLP